LRAGNQTLPKFAYRVSMSSNVIVIANVIQKKFKQRCRQQSTLLAERVVPSELSVSETHAGQQTATDFCQVVEGF